MKEITTVHLTREDIEVAIKNYIKPKGYESKKVTFVYSCGMLNGAHVVVNKIDNDKEEK